jgi:putative N6-adenine-specific DNA methylase
MIEHFFASCPRGLESVLRDELVSLGGQEVIAVDGGVQFSGPYALCYRINLESRIASRVLWRIAQSRYRSEKDIYVLARRIPWQKWFGAKHTLRVDTAAIKSPLTSLEFVTLRVKDAICDTLREAEGERPNIDTRQPDVRVHTFLTADHATIYLDTSGEPLFKRGWRQTAGDAPIRENLAAGILRLAGWQPEQTLFDPMCGSGTFLIEAALIAQRRAPGLHRTFGFERLKNFSVAEYSAIREAAIAQEDHTVALAIYGSDRSGDAIVHTQKNLMVLGLESKIHIKQCQIEDATPPTPSGLVITNPPYGVRMEELDTLAEWYPALGDLLKQRYSGWTAFILTGDLRITKIMRLKASRRTPLFNGALECRLFRYELVAGSMRKP